MDIKRQQIKGRISQALRKAIVTETDWKEMINTFQGTGFSLVEQFRDKENADQNRMVYVCMYVASRGKLQFLILLGTYLNEWKSKNDDLLLNDRTEIENGSSRNIHSLISHTM